MLTKLLHYTGLNIAPFQNNIIIEFREDDNNELKEIIKNTPTIPLEIHRYISITDLPFDLMYDRDGQIINFLINLFKAYDHFLLHNPGYEYNYTRRQVLSSLILSRGILLSPNEENDLIVSLDESDRKGINMTIHMFKKILKEKSLISRIKSEARTGYRQLIRNIYEFPYAQGFDRNLSMFLIMRSLDVLLIRTILTLLSLIALYNVSQQYQLSEEDEITVEFITSRSDEYYGKFLFIKTLLEEFLVNNKILKKLVCDRSLHEIGLMLKNLNENRLFDEDRHNKIVEYAISYVSKYAQGVNESEDIVDMFDACITDLDLQLYSREKTILSIVLLLYVVLNKIIQSLNSCDESITDECLNLNLSLDSVNIFSMFNDIIYEAFLLNQGFIPSFTIDKFINLSITINNRVIGRPVSFRFNIDYVLYPVPVNSYNEIIVSELKTSIPTFEDLLSYLRKFYMRILLFEAYFKDHFLSSIRNFVENEYSLRDVEYAFIAPADSVKKLIECSNDRKLFNDDLIAVIKATSGYIQDFSNGKINVLFVSPSFKTNCIIKVDDENLYIEECYKEA